MTTIKELKRQFADGEIDHLQYAKSMSKIKQHRSMMKCTKELAEIDPDTFDIISDKERSIEYLLSFIEDDEQLTEYTNDIIRNKVPKYFWKRPSSSSGKYHPKDERCYYGLVLHTCRVTKVVHDITTFTNIKMNIHDRNITVVAAILHDTLKYGINPVKEHTLATHPLIACDYLDLPDDISRIIKSHYGSWFTPDDYQKMDDMQRALYFADGLSSRSYIIVNITE